MTEDVQELYTDVQQFPKTCKDVQKTCNKTCKRFQCSCGFMFKTCKTCKMVLKGGQNSHIGKVKNTAERIES